MQVIEKEKYYFLVFKSVNQRDTWIVNSKPWRHYGTAHQNWGEAKKYSYCESVKILEVDIKNPKKTCFLDKYERKTNKRCYKVKNQRR